MTSYILCHNLEFCKIFVKNIFPGDDYSWYWELEEISSEFRRDEEISSEIRKVEGFFNSSKLWWDFFPFSVSRVIVTRKNILNKSFAKYLVVTQKMSARSLFLITTMFMLSRNLMPTDYDIENLFYILICKHHFYVGFPSHILTI